jgi:glutamine amidotransferase
MSGPNVTIVDYGVGNLLSVKRGFEHCGAMVTLTGNREDILSAERVVLPGVGAFGNAMGELSRLGLVEVLRLLAARQTPLLSICLGMQLLLDESEEFGLTPGLGIIPGRVVPVPVRTSTGAVQKIPHIGWNALQPANGNGWVGTILEDNIPGDSVYFVHSFMAITSDPRHLIAATIYGGSPVPAVIAKGNITACQFHPEKSGEVGLKILRRFLLQ